MREILLKLANILDSRGLYSEADLCENLIRVQADESEEVWLEEPCNHESDEDQCHVCGKELL